MNICVHYHTWIYVRNFCCRCHCLSRVLSPNMSPNFAKQQQKQQQPIPFPQSHKKKNTLLHRTNRILNIIFSPHQQAITIKCLVTKTNMIVRIEGSRYFYLPKILLLARKQTGVVLRSRVSSI